MVFGKVESHEQLADRIQAITPQEIMEISQELFAPEVMSTLLYI